jgi:hypothetical protein
MNLSSPSRGRVPIEPRDARFYYVALDVFHLGLDYATLTRTKKSTRLSVSLSLKKKVLEMYCPQCGQQQASNEMRFCSRCGFPLGGVVELIAQGGAFRSGNEQSQEQTLSPRRRGVRQGVLMMLVGAVLVPVLAILNGFIHGPNLLDLLVPLSAVICFAGGFMRILYAVIYEEGVSGMKHDMPAYVPPVTPAQLNTGVRGSALPPPQSIPVPTFAPRRANTAELVPPPSVTENTTRLLDEDKHIRNE